MTAATDNQSPLRDLRVLDFTTLLPGPLATLFFAEAGASVVKIERPGGGDRGRANQPQHQGESIQFALLHRGKKSIALDLKLADARAQALRLASEADVLVEQFRPGVMDRLGLGYEALKTHNPRLIYCSISGFGQDGPSAQVAGHDMNYIARTGMLALSVDSNNRPTMPHGAVADIGGGSLPAVINVLMALIARQASGVGCHLDIAMAENTFAWLPRALAPVFLGQPAPEGRTYRHTGGSPRYGIYMAADGVALSAAPIEEPFWRRFTDLIGLKPDERDDSGDPFGVRDRVAARIATRTSVEWMVIFGSEDVCVEIVQDVAAAFNDPHFRARGVFARELRLHEGRNIPALPLPLASVFTRPEGDTYPDLGSTQPDAADIWRR
jgi:crotonobetainyl-CoA:carnitine CoA-transferase CaiB-like acyl-CoA transferase